MTNPTPDIHARLQLHPRHGRLELVLDNVSSLSNPIMGIADRIIVSGENIALTLLDCSQAGLTVIFLPETVA